MHSFPLLCSNTWQTAWRRTAFTLVLEASVHGCLALMPMDRTLWWWELTDKEGCSHHDGQKADSQTGAKDRIEPSEAHHTYLLSALRLHCLKNFPTPKIESLKYMILGR